MKIQSSKLGIVSLLLTISIVLLLTAIPNTAGASKNSDFRLSQSNIVYVQMIPFVVTQA